MFWPKLHFKLKYLLLISPIIINLENVSKFDKTITSRKRHLVKIGTYQKLCLLTTVDSLHKLIQHFGECCYIRQCW